VHAGANNFTYAEASASIGAAKTTCGCVRRCRDPAEPCGIQPRNRYYGVEVQIVGYRSAGRCDPAAQGRRSCSPYEGQETPGDSRQPTKPSSERALS